MLTCFCPYCLLSKLEVTVASHEFIWIQQCHNCCWLFWSKFVGSGDCRNGCWYGAGLFGKSWLCIFCCSRPMLLIRHIQGCNWVCNHTYNCYIYIVIFIYFLYQLTSNNNRICNWSDKVKELFIKLTRMASLSHY